MSKKPSKPVIAYTRRTPQGTSLSVSVDAAKLEDKPAKVMKVRRPSPAFGFSAFAGTFEDAPHIWRHDALCLTRPESIRKLAAWMEHAAAWIEQQNGGKR